MRMRLIAKILGDEVVSISVCFNAGFVVVEETLDGIFLYSYDTKGGFIGDSWHANIDDAKGQASFQYGEFIQGWNEIPEDVDDISAYVLACVGAAESLSKRYI